MLRNVTAKSAGIVLETTKVGRLLLEFFFRK
jgi:hypothetical protein